MNENKRSKFFVTLKGNMSDDSAEEVYDDSFILALANLIAEDEAQMTTVVEKRVKEVELSAEILRKIVSGDHIWINCRIHDPFPSTGSVSVIGNDIIIEDMNQFCHVAELASNVEIYSEVSGAVHIDFAFDGLMRR